MEAVDTSWPALTAIISVHAAEKRVKVQILVFLIIIDCQACNSLKNNVCSCPCLVIGLRKKNRSLRNLLILPRRTQTVPLSFIRHSSIVGAMDGQGMVQSPGSSSGTKKKSNPTDKNKGHSTKHSKSGSEKPVKSPTPNPHRSSADAGIEELDQKWLDKFNRLEALLLAKLWINRYRPLLL